MRQIASAFRWRFFQGWFLVISLCSLHSPILQAPPQGWGHSKYKLLAMCCLLPQTPSNYTQIAPRISSWCLQHSGDARYRAACLWISFSLSSLSCICFEGLIHILTDLWENPAASSGLGKPREAHRCIWALTEEVSRPIAVG